MRFSVAQGLLLGFAVIAHGAFLVCFLMGIDVGVLACEVSCGVFFLLTILVGVIRAEEQIVVEHVEDSEHKRSKIHVDELIEQLAERREQLEQAEARLEESGSRMLSIEQENIYYKQKAESLSKELEEVKSSLENADTGFVVPPEPAVEQNAISAAEEKVFDSEMINIAKAAESVVQNMRDRLDGAGIDVRIVKPDEELYAKADRGLIDTLFSNIIDNSVKYMNHSGMLQITLSEVADDLFIVMKDNGVGIPSSETRRVFDRDYKSDGRENDGTGHGLAQVAAIVERYGGKVYARSERNKGLGVYIRLPKAATKPMAYAA